jgi:hypothetical protein
VREGPKVAALLAGQRHLAVVAGFYGAVARPSPCCHGAC